MRLLLITLLFLASVSLTAAAPAAPVISGAISSPSIVHRVDTVTTLRDISGGPGRKAALVLGGSAIADGGAKMYTWSTSSTATDDGVTVVKPTAINSGSPGRWLISTVAAHGVSTSAGKTAQRQIDELTPYVGDRSARYFGHQLASLRDDLINPLVQFIGVVLIGDSITWGVGSSAANSVGANTGLLDAPRNNATSPSWANLFHTFLGLEYFSDSSVTAAAWPGSPSGEAVMTYNKTVNLSPLYAPFATYSSGGGGGGSWGNTAGSGSAVGRTLDGVAPAGGDVAELTWTMTGTGFDLIFASVGDGARYELFVDEVSQGVFDTRSTDLGVPIQYGNVRTHNFGSYKRNAAIKIRVVAGDPVTRRLLRIEAVRINRTLRVTNQGISGTNANRYASLMVGDAVGDDDAYAFIQLGTNDRAEPGSNGYAEAQNALRYNLARVVAGLSVTTKPVLMIANAVTNNSAPTYKYDMGAVRSAILDYGKAASIDVVDNYAITKRQAVSAIYMGDGLHPNDYGYWLMFQNLRRALENAE